MAVEQVSVEYGSPQEMQRDVIKRSMTGWEVVSQSSYTPRKGLLRTVLGGFLFFNRKPRTIVTYRRAKQESRP